MKKQELDITLHWVIKLNRQKRCIEVSMVEMIGDDLKTILFVENRTIKIRFWDSAESLEKKIYIKQMFMVSKYKSDRDLFEDVGKICFEMNKKTTVIGKMTIYEDNQRETVAKKTNSDNLRNIKDFLNPKKD